MVNKNFGQLLRKFRKINQLTQQQVADVLNIHRTTYTYYENGITEPSIDVNSMFFLGLLIGIIIGALVGITLMALLSSANRR